MGHILIRGGWKWKEGMKMRAIPKAKLTRLYVQMNIKNEKKQMTQSCEAVARETILVSRNRFV